MIGVTTILKKTLHEDNSKAETGAFWYGAGCSTIIVFFAYLGVVCKSRIPEAHTILEVIRIRYGNVAHLSFTFLAVINNLLNTINMILGASATISFLTGIHIMASTFLLPLGVVLYTLVGGIKATFLTDYIHTFIILILCCWLTIKVLVSEHVGSIGGLYDLVVAAEERHYIDGNYGGSLLTMTSQQGIFFAIILLASNFGAVVMDTGYFLKAFAASPSAVVPGYVVGGIAYFSVPWCLGTIVGMASLGLEALPIFPTYPRLMTSAEVTNGLALPYVAVAVAGKGGAVAVLLMTFMAVTSTLSAQIMAVSSILTFDIYRVYFNKHAGNKEVIRWGHFGVVIFGVVAAAFTAMFHYIGIDMGWTLYMLGVVTCPGVIPLIFTIIWRKQREKLAIDSEDTDEPPRSTQDDKSASSTTVEAVNDDTHRRWARYALYWAVATFLGHWVLWPLPMYAAKYIFSREFFTAWTVVSLIWLFWTVLAVGFYPIWDGRQQILLVLRNLWKLVHA
ncbi:hypothetical protein G7Z17_g1262 [Cylindrodendrum hubeiense]|uniref:Urea active transporter n=1 Tax=Cylindrodendrum hubeiense TaxID=595255 RepID=A0A9P5HL54_9HYPO|nr:hypothetical protein G7Z17_g1262 [Cylindrodendrum hubeiense]